MKPRKKIPPQTSAKVGQTSCSNTSKKNTKQAVISKYPKDTEAQHTKDEWIPVSSQETEAPKYTRTEPDTDLGSQQDSVLSRYIERFRHGRPQSREERRRTTSVGQERAPFWWTSSSSSPPFAATNKIRQEEVSNPDVFDVDQHDGSSCQISQSFLSDISLSELDDLEILQLQERAGRLLQRDVDCCVYEDSVGSEGLGCTDVPPTGLDDPLQRLSTGSFLKTTAMFGSDSGVIPARPDQDILSQWRLRRKMEQASQQSKYLGFYASARGQHQSPANRLDYTDQRRDERPQRPAYVQTPHLETTESIHPPCVSSGSQPDSTSRVPSHVHLLCDVLPCPVRASQTTVHQRVQTLPCPCKASEKTEEPARENTPAASVARSKPVEASSGRRMDEDELMKESHFEGKNTKTNTRRRKPTRCSAGSEHAALQTNIQSAKHRIPKKATLSAEKERRQDSLREGDKPPSPIHSALGQVVSEVLFPAEVSSSAPVSSSEPASAPPAPPKPTNPPHDAQESVQVIWQLLQEAEDSDEKEFEDDPLLQVLRRQRRGLKEQIRAVDLMLEELPEERRTST